MATLDRLSSPAAFRAAFANGRSHACGTVIVYVAKRTEGSGPARAGFVVSRKVGGAVARNRSKRLLREALRLTTGELPTGLDLVIVARASIAGAPYRQVAADLSAALEAAGLPSAGSR